MKKIFEFLIGETDDTGVKTISLVDDPAMKSDFIKFQNEKPKPKYIALQKDGDDYKQVVAGLSMIPDKLIFRVDPETKEEYYGYFSIDTIEQIRNKYHKEMMTSNVNLDHDEKAYIDAYLIESYILSTEARVEEVTAQGIDGAVIGAWYSAFKIEDEEIFQKVLDGEFNGFSIEAYLNKELATIDASLKNNFKEKEKKMKKTLIERFKDFLETLEAEDENVESTESTDNLETALVPEENISITWGEVGAEVTKTYTSEEEEEITEPVGQGEFVLEDGRVVVVDENSMLIEVKEKPAEEEESTESTETSTDEENLETESTESTESTEESTEVKAEESTEETTETESTEKSDLDKSLKDLLDLSKNGEYSVMVSVYDGEVQYGSISSWTEIKMKSDVDAETKVLNDKITELEAKLAEPIAEPQLTDKVETDGEVKELTVYEAIAKRKGLPTV